MTMLQQSPTFRPFMRELVSSTAIACRASYDKVIRPICAAAIQRDNMIIVMFPPLYFLLTPVAFAFLSFVLFFHVLNGICAFCIEFTCMAVMIAFSKFLSYFRAITVGFVHSSVMFSYFWTAISGFLLLIQSLMVFLAICFLIWNVADAISLSYAWTIKIFFNPRLVICVHTFFDFWATLVFFALGACTFFALRSQSVFSFSPAIKEVGCCRKSFTAYGTLLLRGVLGYSVHTSESPFIRHVPGCFQHRRDTTLLPLHYTITPLVMQVYEVIS